MGQNRIFVQITLLMESSNNVRHLPGLSGSHPQCLGVHAVEHPCVGVGADVENHVAVALEGVDGVEEEEGLC